LCGQVNIAAKMGQRTLGCAFTSTNLHLQHRHGDTGMTRSLNTRLRFWAVAALLAGTSSIALAQPGSPRVPQKVLTDPLTFIGTGSLGLATSDKSKTPAKVLTESLTFVGTGSLGLTDSTARVPKKVLTDPLTFIGTGKLLP
jgi:hypothetical protein